MQNTLYPPVHLGLFIPLSILGSLAMDLYIPAVPGMITVFETTPAIMQWTLSIFMLSTAIGQLVLGPLTDHFGRKIIAILSTLIFIFASVACAFSSSVEHLVFFRFLQGFGACGSSVACAAMVRDLYNAEQSGRLYSQINGAVGLAPILAPIIGGYILLGFNAWEVLFMALAFFGLIPFALCLDYPETLKNIILESKLEPNLKTSSTSFSIPLRSKNHFSVLKRFYQILKNKQFFCFMLAVLTGMAGLFTFFSASSEILITYLDVPAEHFGFYFGMCAIAYTLGSFLSPNLQAKVGRPNTVILGNLSIILGSLLMISWYYLAGTSALALVCPMLFISSGIGLMMGCAYAMAMEPFGEMAGTAAALLGSLQFLGAMILGHHAMQYDLSTPLPIALTMLPLGIICVLSVRYFLNTNG